MVTISYYPSGALFFKPTTSLRSDPGVLVTKSLTNFQKAPEIFSKHEGTEFHKFSILQMDDFIKVMTNQQPSIPASLQQSMAEQIALNRKKLLSIVETIMLCGRQNIPF